MLLGDHSALEGLDTLTLAFLDANGHANGVADFELGLVLFDHALGDNLHCVHCKILHFYRRSYPCNGRTAEDRLF